MITEKDIDRFTNGDCFILAKALHRLTGWPLYAFVDNDGIPDMHGFVKMPDGRFLDVEGPHEIQAFHSKWDAGERNFPYSAFHGWGTAFGKHSYHRANQVARELVSNLK